jgi:hypothetical protein
MEGFLITLVSVVDCVKIGCLVNASSSVDMWYDVEEGEPKFGRVGCNG